MDGDTERAAEERAFRHIMLDLEQLVKYQNRVLYAFLGIAVFFGIIALWLLWRLDAMNALTLLAG